MIGFYKKNIDYLTEAAVNPDRRRYAVAEEGARHYIDLDHYADSSGVLLPRYWEDAVVQRGEDSLRAHGIVPWHIYRMYFELRNAFGVRDPSRILRLSAELGHYIADAHVPLHTTSNYDGQKTGQTGIHAFWESRLPELYYADYDFIVGKASYIRNVQLAAWDAVCDSYRAMDSVLRLEKELFAKEGSRKFSFESKGSKTIKVVSFGYAARYHKLLSGMVERRFRASIKMTADVWYTAWVDAGQPDLAQLIDYHPTPEEIRAREAEWNSWQSKKYAARSHESGLED